MYFSGFVEMKNVKDYVQNRSAYVNLGKGSDFKKAVNDIDAQLNGSQVCTHLLQSTISNLHALTNKNTYSFRKMLNDQYTMPFLSKQKMKGMELKS